MLSEIAHWIVVVWVVSGVAMVGGMALRDWLEDPAEELVADDPYRASLDAAARISAMAFEADRLMQAAVEQARREEDTR